MILLKQNHVKSFKAKSYKNIISKIILLKQNHGTSFKNKIILLKQESFKSKIISLLQNHVTKLKSKIILKEGVLTFFL